MEKILKEKKEELLLEVEKIEITEITHQDVKKAEEHFIVNVSISHEVKDNYKIELETTIVEPPYALKIKCFAEFKITEEFEKQFNNQEIEELNIQDEKLLYVKNNGLVLMLPFIKNSFKNQGFTNEELFAKNGYLDPYTVIGAIEIIEKRDFFNYQMLDRLRTDCNYYINNYNVNEELQNKVSKILEEMESYYNKIKIKPVWFHLSDFDKIKKHFSLN